MGVIKPKHQLPILQTRHERRLPIKKKTDGVVSAEWR